MKKFLPFLSSFSGLFLLVASLCNFFLAYQASKSVQSVVVTNRVVEVSSSFFPTNDLPSIPSFSGLSSLTSPPSPPPPSPPPAPRQLADYPYQYFLVGRRIGAMMFGRYYYEGSPCSLGRIKYIYPDRIILDSGDWIQNRFEFANRKTRIEQND